MNVSRCSLRAVLEAVTRQHIVKTQKTVREIVNCKECEIRIALQLILVTICKCSINQVTNRNPISGQCDTLQYDNVNTTDDNCFSLKES
jgi:hypothetical protein